MGFSPTTQADRRHDTDGIVKGNFFLLTMVQTILFEIATAKCALPYARKADADMRLPARHTVFHE